MIPQGYKRTEIGIIPEDWDIKKWSDVALGFTSGATPYRANSEFYVGDIKWVSSGELNYNYINDTIEHISLNAKEKTNLAMHPKGTFLMAITGLEAAGTRGSCAILDCEATTNQSCMAIYGTKDLSIKYLFHYYRLLGDELAFRYCQGTKQQSYTAKIVKSLPIFLPNTLFEQEKIAEALSDTDDLISSLEKLIEKKKAIKQGAMQNLLTGKTRLPGFTGEWEEKTINEFGCFVNGNGFPLKYQGHQSGVYPFYKVSDFNKKSNRKEMIKANNYISNDVVKALSCNIIPKNSILFAKIGAAIALERKRITKFDCCIDNNMMSFQPYQEKVVLYMCYLFQTIRFSELIEATALPSLSGKSIGAIKKLFPPTIEEQKTIAEILSDMDKEIEQLEQKLAKARLIKQGMMQQLLTGKIRLV